MPNRFTATERLILMSLRHDPYQTSAELLQSTGAGETQFTACLRTLIAAREVQLTANGYHYIHDADQPPHFMAILQYLGCGKAPYGELAHGELAHAEHEIRSALISHRRDRWGRAFPGGLNQVELQWATRHTMDELTAALDRMVRSGEVIETIDDEWVRRYQRPEAVQQ
jgi:hypothetical protein